MDLKDLADPNYSQDASACWRGRAHRSDRARQRHGADEKWTAIRSRLLGGEEILFVNDKKDLKTARAAHPGKVVYLPPEAEELWMDRDRHDFEALVGAAHMVKKAFSGWIIPGGVSRFGSWRWR